MRAPESLPEILDVAVVGAGFSGLGVSREFKRLGLSHGVLERRGVGDTWLSQRWDSFHTNIPNEQMVMPNEPYQGPDPEGFLTRDAFVALLRDYAARHAPAASDCDGRRARAGPRRLPPRHARRPGPRPRGGRRQRRPDPPAPPGLRRHSAAGPAPDRRRRLPQPGARSPTARCSWSATPRPAPSSPRSSSSPAAGSISPPAGLAARRGATAAATSCTGWWRAASSTRRAAPSSGRTAASPGGRPWRCRARSACSR